MGNLHKVSDKQLSEWIKEVESGPSSNDNAAPFPSKPPDSEPSPSRLSLLSAPVTAFRQLLDRARLRLPVLFR